MQTDFVSFTSLPWPCVNARNFKAIMPCARVSSLILWTRAYAMPVRFAVLPAAAECAAVLKVESTAADLCSLCAALRRDGFLHVTFSFFSHSLSLVLTNVSIHNENLSFFFCLSLSCVVTSRVSLLLDHELLSSFASRHLTLFNSHINFLWSAFSLVFFFFFSFG